jgi:uncharacterized protein YggT (Ycf19 family)
MADFTEEVTATKEAGVASNGSVVRRQTRSVASTAGPRSTLANVVWYLYGLVAILLALRFILKLAGANATNGFVHFIYSITATLSAPFDSIFGVSTASNQTITSVFEPSILVAIVIYGLIAWGLVRLLEINKPKVAA